MAFGKPPAREVAALALGILFAALTIATDQQDASDLDELRARYESHLSLTNRPLVKLGDNYQQALVNLKKELQAKGAVDNIRIYNRALSAEEVAEIF